MRYAFKRLFSGSFYFSLRSILKLILGESSMEPQAVWAVIAGVLILALAFFFCRPEAFWRLTEQWKSYRADEPPAFTASAPNSAVFVLWRRGFHCPFAFSPAVAPFFYTPKTEINIVIEFTAEALDRRFLLFLFILEEL